MRVTLALLFVLLAVKSGRAEGRWYPCWMVRAYVATHSKADVEAMARKHKVTDAERKRAAACFKKAKK